MRLWDKGGATDAEMLRYTARDDYVLDQSLLLYDLRATRAHVRGLGRADVLPAHEVEALEQALVSLERDLEQGKLTLTEDDEDGHSAIEDRLIERLGDVGKKVHTGRSRNDQVLVATRLYQRDALDGLMAAAQEAGQALLVLARRERDTPMPGYTHLQRAVPSSVGLWAAAFVEGFVEALGSLRHARKLVNRSPLGAAAGYGVNLPLDREGVAQDLGFEGVAINPMASQSSRGVTEAMVLSAAWHLMAVIRRLAWDVSLFCTSEFGFLKLDEAMTTGSSIMPNKRNPDVVELLRASCSVVQAAIVELQSITALPSGYQRDLQLTKAPMMRGLSEATMAVRIIPRLLEGMKLDATRMAEAISPECYATDRAIELTRDGVPFRDAYRQVAEEVARAQAETTDTSAKPRANPQNVERAGRSLKARVSYGAAGNLALDDLERLLREA